MWCVGHAILALSSPTRPGLLEMLRQCGELGMQYWLGPVLQDLVCWGSVVFWACSIGSVAQQGLVCWICLGNVVCLACSIGSVQSNNTGLLEMLRQCGVLGMQYWLCPV